MTFSNHLDGAVRRIEDMPAPAVSAVEAAGVAPVQAPDRRRQPVRFERSDQVIVRRHETEAVADEKSLGDQFGDDLDAVVIVAVVSENVLLGDRPSRDVERACVRRAHPFTLPMQTVQPATQL